MSRRYSEQIRVWIGPDQGGSLGPEPVRFRWRRRTYVVTEVLGRWIETGVWWPAAGAASGVGATDHPVADRRVWRVEARTGTRTGVFDLCDRGPATSGGDGDDLQWALLAALD